MTLLIQLLALLLPSSLKRALFTSALGWQIGERATIGASLICAQRVRIGRDVHIGHLNLVGRLRSLEVGDGTVIGNLNHFSAGEHTNWPDSFWIGEQAKVTSRHFFDCSGGIRIGAHSLIGGRDTHCWTHYYDGRTIQSNELVIGDRCYVGARSTLIYCQVPDDCVVGAGSVVTRDFTGDGEGLLIAGNPAEVKKRFALERVK